MNANALTPELKKRLVMCFVDGGLTDVLGHVKKWFADEAEALSFVGDMADGVQSLREEGASRKALEQAVAKEIDAFSHQASDVIVEEGEQPDVIANWDLLIAESGSPMILTSHHGSPSSGVAQTETGSAVDYTAVPLRGELIELSPRAALCWVDVGSGVHLKVEVPSDLFPAGAISPGTRFEKASGEKLVRPVPPPATKQEILQELDQRRHTYETDLRHRKLRLAAGE